MLIITLIASFLQSTIQQCNELSLELYNTELTTGILPTAAIQNILDADPDEDEIYQPLSATVTGTGSNPWTIQTQDFIMFTNLTSQTYTGSNADGNQGTIAVSNPTVQVLVYFTISNTTIVAQGVAVMDAFTNANYSFNVVQGKDSYTFTYQTSYINFTGTNFDYIYANFPYTSKELSQILSQINKQQSIQTALNTYYANFGTSVTNYLNGFTIQKQYTDVSFTYSSPTKGQQSYDYTITPQQLLIQYSNPVGYYISAQMDINNLNKDSYTCSHALSQYTETKVYDGNAELISLDVIINSFQYGLQQGYYSTILSSAFWNVEYFSWITGGLNNVITGAYTSFPLNTAVIGSCSSSSGAFVGVYSAGTKLNSLYFNITFDCNLSAAGTQILGFQIAFAPLNVTLNQNIKEHESYLSFNIVPSNYTVTYTNQPYSGYNTDLLEWYVNSTIDSQFFGMEYLSDVFPTQRRGNQSFTFTNLALFVADSEQ